MTTERADEALGRHLLFRCIKAVFRVSFREQAGVTCLAIARLPNGGMKAKLLWFSSGPEGNCRYLCSVLRDRLMVGRIPLEDVI